MKSKSTYKFIVLLFTSFALASTCYSQDVPEEARKHYARGQAAIEIMQGEADYAGVIQEFETAIQLAPAWADPYYDLGMFQDKIGNYDVALTHLNKYLELAPQAANASQVQNTIYKIEFKRDKAADMDMMIDLLVNGKLKLSGKFRGGICHPNEFYVKSEKIYADVRCWEAESYGHTVPVQFDGTTISLTYYNYVCPTETDLKMWPCEERIEMTGTVTSKNPLRFSMKQKVILTKDKDDTPNYYEGEWEFSK